MLVGWEHDADLYVPQIEEDNLLEMAHDGLAEIVPLAGLMRGKPMRDSE